MESNNSQDEDVDLVCNVGERFVYGMKQDNADYDVNEHEVVQEAEQDEIIFEVFTSILVANPLEEDEYQEEPGVSLCHS